MPTYRVTEPFSFRVFHKNVKVFEVDSADTALALAKAEHPKYEANGWDDEDDDDYSDDDTERGWLTVEALTSAGRWTPCPRVTRDDGDSVTTVCADDGAERPDDSEDAMKAFFQEVLNDDKPIKPQRRV